MVSLIQQKILRYFSERSSEEIHFKCIMKAIGEDRPSTNRTLYELQNQKVLKKTSGSPPMWKVDDNVPQYCEKFNLSLKENEMFSPKTEKNKTFSEGLTTTEGDINYIVAQKIFSIVSDSDVPILKTYFEEAIDSKRTSSRILTAKQLLDVLDTRDCLNASNIRAIGEVLKNEKIINLVKENEAKLREGCILCIQYNELTDAINYVYPRIGTAWVHLARALGLPDYSIDVIKADNRLTKDQANAALALWREQMGSNALLYDLINALESVMCERKDLADDLRKGEFLH